MSSSISIKRGAFCKISLRKAKAELLSVNGREDDVLARTTTCIPTSIHRANIDYHLSIAPSFAILPVSVNQSQVYSI
jgi:hypothetical protein